MESREFEKELGYSKASRAITSGTQEFGVNRKEVVALLQTCRWKRCDLAGAVRFGSRRRRAGMEETVDANRAAV